MAGFATPFYPSPTREIVHQQVIASQGMPVFAMGFLERQLYRTASGIIRIAIWKDLSRGRSQKSKTPQS